MPSKGNPVIHCRITADLHEELLTVLEETNAIRVEEPWTLSTFVERAIAEKLAKMRRSKGEQSERFLSRYECEE